MGNQLLGAIDDDMELVQYVDAQNLFPQGMAALGSGWCVVSFDDFAISN